MDKLFTAALIALSATLIAEVDYKEQTKQSYDATAEDYHANTLKLLPEVKARSFLSHLPAQAKILDVGCGSGRDAGYFVEKGHAVTGIDIAPKMIGLARVLVPEATFAVGDIETTLFTMNFFDGVWASASLLHVSKQEMPAVLQKIHSTLKPGGVFYISMKKGEGETLQPDERYGGVPKFWNYMDDQELIAMLINQGFEILEHDVHEKSTSYQTHPWISVVCKKCSQGK